MVPAYHSLMRMRMI